MKPNQNPKPAVRPAPPPPGASAGKLNLPLEQAKREAAKLHVFRDDLERQPLPGDTDARSSLLGRAED